MFTDEVQKLSADVCLYVHAVGRIKPNYVSLSVLAAVLFCLGAKLRVTENRCVLFNLSTYVYLALLPQH